VIQQVDFAKKQNATQIKNAKLCIQMSLWSVSIRRIFALFLVLIGKIVTLTRYVTYTREFASQEIVDQIEIVKRMKDVTC
jgi:hypothetical protein